MSKNTKPAAEKAVPAADAAAVATTPAADPTPPTAEPEALVKARVLVDFAEHKCDEVVSASAEQIGAWKAAGQVDDHPSAVAYAEGLKAGARLAALDSTDAAQE
jgi:hypothetical protein